MVPSLAASCSWRAVAAWGTCRGPAASWASPHHQGLLEGSLMPWEGREGRGEREGGRKGGREGGGDRDMIRDR